MNNEEQRFTKLVQQHKETIYSVCLMFAEDQDDVNDLMQEVLIRLWNGFGSYQGTGDVRGWIWRVTMNTCITQNEKRKKDKERQPLFEDMITAQAEDNRQIRMLHDRIHRLQPFDRAIIMLWLEDLSYEEIGQIVGITAKNVSVRLVRIKEQLKSMNS